MIAFPNCKINLGLSIIAKRADGYHALETVFYPVQLQDMVEIVHSNDSQKELQFTSTGIYIPGDETQNLCIKAYQIIKKDFPQIPAIKMHLHKHIPMGAGLGGGSSDGTAILKLLNDQFSLGLNTNQLIHYAAQLGSDCPFFVHNNPCHATGRGEILNPINCDLSNYKIALIHPAIHISTAWAFSQLNPHTKEKSIAEIVAQPIQNWKNHLINDFEAPIFLAHPLLQDIKNELYNMGAVYASMSGSGSSLFGIFPNNYSWPTQFMNNKYRTDFI
jgi:4-diphosphocytidyl-2-C-methyl-D-erythritol kinase